jgi:hypothetical protein
MDGVEQARHLTLTPIRLAAAAPEHDMRQSARRVALLGCVLLAAALAGAAQAADISVGNQEP